MNKITFISNNKAIEGFAEEHGFSLLLERDNKKILFDTGQGDAFKQNIKLLNIDISKIDSLVISHGHYDHSGNIEYILNNSNNVKIYLHPNADLTRFSIYEDRNPMVECIGMASENIDILKKYNIVNTLGTTSLYNGVFVTGQIPRKTSEDTGGPFFLDPLGDRDDSIPDDQSLWVEIENGLLIVMGCCHSGLINTVEYIKKISGIDKVFTIIGGLHLKNAKQERVEETIAYLNSLNLRTLFPGHCTGDNITTLFKKLLNCEVIDILAGNQIRFE